MFVIFVFVTILVIIVCAHYTKNEHLRELGKKLPGPPTLPIVGNALEIGKNGTLNYLSQAQKQYGKVTRHWLGPTLYTLMTDPKDIEILLRDTKNIAKSKNYDFVKPWLGKGLITSTGEHWHTHRKIITPAFFFNILERFVEVFNERGKVLIGNLEKKVGQPEFDVYPFINIYALEAIIETAMGVKIQQKDQQDLEYVQAIHQISKVAHYRAFSFLHRSNLTFPFTSLGRQQTKILKVIHGYCKKVITQRKHEVEKLKISDQPSEDELGKKKRLAFLDLLLISQKDGSGLTDDEIREEVDTFMFAGHDTTTSGLSFCLYYLARYPEVQEKVYSEIKDIIGDDVSNLTLKDLQKFKYLDQVIKETLRIAPPIPYISRNLESDLQISNYTLPADSGAGVFIYMLHRDPELYPDPETFNPERFSDENSVGRHPYAFVPFSAGPRNCIGQKYAQLEMKSSVVKLIANFKLLPGAEIEKLQSEIVLKSTNGIKIRIEKRIKNSC